RARDRAADEPSSFSTSWQAPRNASRSDARGAGVHRSTTREGGRPLLSSSGLRIKGWGQKNYASRRLVPSAKPVRMPREMSESQEAADVRFMREALVEADRAAALGEVP